MSDENLEVDLSPIYFSFQIKEIIAKQKNIPFKHFRSRAPRCQLTRQPVLHRGSSLLRKQTRADMNPKLSDKKKGSLEDASKAPRSLDLKQETELDQSLEGLDEVFEWRPPNKAQDHNKHQTPLQRYVSKTEEEILSKQQYIDRLKEKESEIVINLQVLVAHGQWKRLC